MKNNSSKNRTKRYNIAHPNAELRTLAAISVVNLRFARSG